LAISPASFLTAICYSANYSNVYLRLLEVTGFSIITLTYPDGELNSVAETDFCSAFHFPQINFAIAAYVIQMLARKLKNSSSTQMNRVK